MSRILVLGIGNPLMQDDGIGVWVARKIRDRHATGDMEVVIGETDVAYCLDCLQKGDYLVVLDAMAAGGSPGSVRLLPLDEAISRRVMPCGMHDMSLLDAIAADPSVRGVLIGIEPAAIRIGLGLSECLQKQFEQICAGVELLLQKVVEDENA